MCISRSCHSTASSPCDLILVDKLNDACKCASKAPSFAGVLRWTPRMAIVVVVGHLLLPEADELAPVTVPALAYNIFNE